MNCKQEELDLATIEEYYIADFSARLLIVSDTGPWLLLTTNLSRESHVQI